MKGTHYPRSMTLRVAASFPDRIASAAAREDLAPPDWIRKTLSDGLRQSERDAASAGANAAKQRAKARQAERLEAAVQEILKEAARVRERLETGS